MITSKEFLAPFEISTVFSGNASRNFSATILAFLLYVDQLAPWTSLITAPAALFALFISLLLSFFDDAFRLLI